MKMLDSFARCGIRSLHLTGGEPMVRSDFWQFIDAIRERGMIVPLIYSNGFLVTGSFLDELEKRQMRPSFQFSFDGAGFHDWMRGVPGAQKHVTEAFLGCRERGLPTSASMVLCRDNRYSIRETVRLLADLGCRELKISNAFPAGEWKNETAHYLTRAEAFETYLAYIPEFFEDGMPISLSLEGLFNYNKPLNEYGAFMEKNIPEERFAKTLMCGHVRRKMYVSPKGTVLPCMSMAGSPAEDRFPNMLETPLEDILDTQSLYMDIVDLRVSDYMEHNPECRSCEYREGCCGGCRAEAVFDHPADYLAKDSKVCEYYKGGWKQKKEEVLRSLGQLPAAEHVYK